MSGWLLNEVVIVMKQEDKDLLLKDLCARLPYGVKIAINDKVESLQGINILDNVAEYDSFLSFDIEEVKPYLFPLSSMTEKQKGELKDLIHKEMEIVTNQLKTGDCGIDNGKYHFNNILIFDWLNKNHFDYRGLIPMDLATDATGKNIY